MVSVLNETFDNSSQFTITQGSLFTDGVGDYFTLTDGSTIGSFVEVTGFDGQFLAAQDLNGEGGPTTVQIIWSSLDITGLTNLSFSGLFAEDDSSDGNEDWDADSSVSIEYSIDGGAFQSLLAFEAAAGTNTEPGEDTDFDGIGDGTALTPVGQTFVKAIAGTGSSLDLRLTIANLEAGDEDIAIDNIEITGDSAGSVLNSLVFNEVLPDPNSSGANNFDTDGDGTAETGDEFVELYNTSGNTLDIGGLQFWDAGNDNYFTIPGGTMLDPNGYVVVVSDVGGGSLPSVPSGSFAFSAGAGTSGIINNGGDNLVLYDPTADEYIQAVYNGDATDDPTATYTGFSATATQVGSVLDFGNDTDGVSLALSPDGTTGNPVQHNTIGDGSVLATPGNSNIVPASSVLNSLVFNEVLPDPNSSTNNFDTDGDGTAETSDEFVEIYNTSGSTLDIGGLQFWDAGSDNYFTIPGGTMLGANGFVVVVANVAGGSLPTVPSGSFAFSAGGGLSLSNGGDNLVLYDPATDEYIQAIYNGDGVDAPETMPSGNYAGFSASATRIGSVLDFGNDTDGVSLALSPDGATGNPVQHNTIGSGTVLATPGDSNVASSTTLAIAPTTQNEGDSGTTTFSFTVTRSGDTSGTTTVEFATSDGTAIDGVDYTGTSGMLTFNPSDTSETITVDVIGDTDVEPDENFTVTLFNASGGATIATASADGTIQNDDGVSFTLIHDIQGSGTASTLDGNIVTIEGIVVGDFQDGAGTNGDLNGFFIQEEDGDADGNALTSEGIFVFDGSSPAVDVNVGDKVQVTGTVVEFFDLTEITSVTNVTVVSSGNSLPTTTDISLPTASTVTNADGELIADLEQYEGMLVRFTDTLSVTELFQLDRYGEIRLSQGGRLTQFTQTNSPSVAGYSAHLEDVAKGTIMLDDGQSVQNPDPIIFPDGMLDPNDSLRMGDTVTNLTGVLNFSRGSGGSGDATYRLNPTVTPTFTSVNTRPATPDTVGGDLKVASFNVLNYFTTLNSRGADTTSEFNRQSEKLVTALSSIDADIFGLVELENNYTSGGSSAIATLVDNLNATVGAGTYAYVDPGTNVGDDEIAVGVIYKPAAVSIASGTTVEILDDSDLTGLGLSGPIFNGSSTNRAPLAVTFAENATGEEFTIAVNHFKSKGGSGTGANADAGDGAGNWNQRRLEGAQALDAWLDTKPTGTSDSDILILGDLNAYPKEDPIAFLTGEYDDLIADNLGTGTYSFVFDGQAGVLDYALSSSSLTSQVTGVTEWHINADEPDAFDYNEDFNPSALFNGSDPYRASDHDPVIVGLDLSSTLNEITGTSGTDIITGTAGGDRITGGLGRDLLTGGVGSDEFVYTQLRDAGDTITDFTLGEDTLVLTALFASLGESIANFADAKSQGFLSFIDRSPDTLVMLDPDGTGGRGRGRPFVKIANVALAEMDAEVNFIF